LYQTVGGETPAAPLRTGSILAFLCVDTEEEALPKDLSFLPEAVRDRIERYKYSDAKKGSLFAYLLLRRALAEQGKEDLFSCLTSTLCGKPVIDGFPFSLSHCRGVSVCCVCEEEIGVDIEAVRAFDATLVSSVLDAKSLDTYNRLDSQEKDSYFARQWTLRESYLKLTGEGIRLRLNRLAPQLCGIGYLLQESFIVSERIGTDFWLSAATYQEKPPLELHFIKAERLL